MLITFRKRRDWIRISRNVQLGKGQRRGETLVWFGEIERKLAKIIHDYLYLQFFLLIIYFPSLSVSLPYRYPSVLYLPFLPLSFNASTFSLTMNILHTDVVFVLPFCFGPPLTSLLVFSTPCITDSCSRYGGGGRVGPRLYDSKKYSILSFQCSEFFALQIHIFLSFSVHISYFLSAGMDCSYANKRPFILGSAHSFVSLDVSSVKSVHKVYIDRVQISVWRLPHYCPPTPSPPSECFLPPHPRRGYTLARRWGGGGSRHWKTPDIGLASYSIIPLRISLSDSVCLSVWTLMAFSSLRMALTVRARARRSRISMMERACSPLSPPPW